MMRIFRLIVSSASLVFSLRYDPTQVDYNLNQNQTAENVLDYWGEWPDHTFTASPTNWRFPFYTLIIDRYVNGDPSNDDANGTVLEHDGLSNQFRHGGDVQGLVDTLDYIQGMGIKGLYLAGTPFVNVPWEWDGYSPLDLSLLDAHLGTIAQWRAAIEEIHRRGMYVLLDNTMATMGNLIGFEGHLNESVPFTPTEYKAEWKTDLRYHDFVFGNDYNQTCDYPRFWDEAGVLVSADSVAANQDNISQFNGLKGCYNSEFDQYGDSEAFGVIPDWIRQITKFASVQDRLREWVPSVREKIQTFSCITIAMLDIDGFRFDKATQVTPDAQGEFGSFIRQCAQRFGKHNFFMPGEITGGNNFGSIYLGRGRQPDQVPPNITAAVQLTNSSDDKYFLRDSGLNALDGAAFHYSIYRILTRFLGMDGNLTAGFDVPVNFVDTWNTMLTTNDLVNAFTGEFDPRHMYGASNQDVFRWPGIENGIEKQLLALFITTLHMPGIPLLYWGEEQAFYILDSTAANYVFGRQAMSSTPAWQIHGCYKLGSSQYFEFPVNSSTVGCEDEHVSLDHRDPSHPIRNIIKSMYSLRENFPVLKDGAFLQSLSNQTRQVFLPGSNGTVTETGMWSVLRDEYPHGLQSLSAGPGGNQSVWLVYQNDVKTTYKFNCASKDKSFNTTALLAPFSKGKVRNLLAPYETLELVEGAVVLGIDGNSDFNGCLEELTLDAFAFKAYVPLAKWIGPPPMVTSFSPGHDARILAADANGTDTIDIEFQYSTVMDCGSITKSLNISSSQVKLDHVSCSSIDATTTRFVGGVPSQWSWKATLSDVPNGVLSLVISNATSLDGTSTKSVDRFLLRIGTITNPIVFPFLANYSSEVLSKTDSGDLQVAHQAAGADQWRCSLNWGSSWSNWTSYQGGTSTLSSQPWSGTDAQKWSGTHVILQYFSQLAGSSDAVQHADIGSKYARRFPHLFAEGEFNQFGFDGGLNSAFDLSADGTWEFEFSSEWPSTLQVNVWGMNPDGVPDQSFVYGDLDGDGVLDRMVPQSLSTMAVNFSVLPPSPFVAYKLQVDDATLRYTMIPIGSRTQQILMYILLWTVPISTGIISIWTYMGAFYSVKFNKIGNIQKKSLLPFSFRGKFQKLSGKDEFEGSRSTPMSVLRPRSSTPMASPPVPGILVGDTRRKILIATMEYDIEDWAIKIKIGGLGVMAQLMGKSLTHQDLVWVVPCVGGVDYPVDQPAESMSITILGASYEINVQYHVLRNITYVLLDAPVFRQQTKAEPYPPRMDDLDSAVYYSAWNACIAETIKRFKVDLYHINDYHGAAAPLYLLPQTIPVALSLHNAEFQGLWPMRSPKEKDEVCKVFNLDPAIVESYIQFGEVFNLLHAGASYLRVHQKGFGAVGVSNKYGERSFARYPIFWGLKKIGKLPNPDPTDTDPWNPEEEANQVIAVDPAYEATRGALREQAQEWANLTIDPNADLFVFVGRWSTQKGVDLIADVFPSVLEKNPSVQLICIGPVIDLYGRFAALKLAKIMEKYPGRVYSKPEFTTLPPFIFTGAEFALIPSRDEPFGLVAVEFGRKGALGVGARVGGLGQMPGWWFTVESTTTAHMHRQFKKSIEEALASKTEVRAMMRARSAKQRFPVQKWVEDLNTIQSTAIRIHQQEAVASSNHRGSRVESRSRSRFGLRLHSHLRTVSSDRISAFEADASDEASDVPEEAHEEPANGLNRALSLGVRNGPGHRGRRPTVIEPLDLGEPMDSRELLDGIDESENQESDADGPSEYTITREEAEASIRQEQINQTLHRLDGGDSRNLPKKLPLARGRSMNRFRRPSSISIRGRDSSETSTPGHSPDPRGRFLLSPNSGEDWRTPQPASATTRGLKSVSVLSLAEVKGSRTDYSLQKIDANFEDTNEYYYHAFEERLTKLDGKTSEGELCIEDYLVESEKAWFKRMRDAKLGRTPRNSRGPSPNPSLRSPSVFTGDTRVSSASEGYFDVPAEDGSGLALEDEFLLGKDYKRPWFLTRWMTTRFLDWPVYSFALALGQIMAANSFQITLLTGGQTENNEKLYIIGTIYIVASLFWWMMFRKFKAVYTLSIPFMIYGLAFILVGISAFQGAGIGRDWVRNVATGVYVAASASGSLFFALNFGDEGGAPIKSWVYRACIIQGTQQIYISAMFYWGNTMAQSSQMSDINSLSTSTTLAYITLPIALLLILLGIAVLISLPTYYHQTPGTIPSFYATLLRRRIIAWFFATVMLQNFFLSTPYGRNWGYLYSSSYIRPWTIAVLVITFFIGLWLALLVLLGRLSTAHSWILPIFAIGLGAPRWAQMLWGTSGIGLWLPWFPGAPQGGAIAGRALWLWLGLLDALQGVGFGMMLLQTLTRIHIAVSLMAAQVLGTLVTMLAKAVAPDRDGPGDVFPDFSRGVMAGLSKPWFWIALACQLVIPIGFFKFFRKEQLSKP